MNLMCLENSAHLSVQILVHWNWEL